MRNAAGALVILVRVCFSSPCISPVSLSLYVRCKCLIINYFVTLFWESMPFSPFLVLKFQKLFTRIYQKYATVCICWCLKYSSKHIKFQQVMRPPALPSSVTWLVVFNWLEPGFHLDFFCERLKIYPQVKFLGITFDSKTHIPKALWGNPGALQHQVPSCKTYSQ